VNPWTSFGVLLTLLFGVAGVALSGGLWAGVRFAQERTPTYEETSSTRAEVVARTPQRTTPGGDGLPPGYVRGVRIRRGERGGAGPGSTLRRRGTPGISRGFRGRDLSDREVEAWLRRWNL